MTPRYIRDRLRELLEEVIAARGDPNDPAHYLAGCVEDIASVRTFDEAGVSLMDEGLVVETTDGVVFRLLIVRAK